MIGGILALVVGAVLAKHGFAFDEAGWQRLVLAHTFRGDPSIFWTRIRWDYLFGDAIEHAELIHRPLWPLLLEAVAAKGDAGAERAAALSWAPLLALFPLWLWATPERRRGKRAETSAGRGARGTRATGGSADSLLGRIATAMGGATLFLVIGGAALAGDIRAGGPGAWVVSLAIVALGAWEREEWTLAGVACGVLYHLSPAGELLFASFVLAAVIEALFSRERRSVSLAGSLLAAGSAFGGVVAPWAIRTAMLGGLWVSPFLTDLLVSPMAGASALRHWYAATGSGLPSPEITFSIPLFSDYTRTAWFAWAGALVGPFVGEALPPSAAWAVALMAGAVRAISLRVATLWVAGSAVWLAALAGWAAPDDSVRLLVPDVILAAGLARAAGDPRRWIAWGFRAWVALMVASNARPLMRELYGPGRRMEGNAVDTAAVTALLARQARGEGPVLLGRTEGLRVSEAGDRHRIAVLPGNYRDPGVTDAFVERLGIRWTTRGEELASVLRRHGLERRDTEAGATLWEIKALR